MPCIGPENASNVVPFNYSGNHTMPLTVATASLSMVGSFLIILTYCIWPDIHSTARRFLVYVSIGDFINSGGNLLGVVFQLPEEEGLGCEVQSFFTTFSCLGFIFWTTYLAAFLYMSIVRGHVKLPMRIRVVFFLTGWGIPVVVTVAALLSDALGNDNSTVSAGWCWTNDYPDYPTTLRCEDARLMWRLLTAKGWEVLSYLLVPLFYVLVHNHIKKESLYPSETLVKPSTLQIAQKIHRKFTALPMVYVLLRMWGTIRFFLDVFDMNHEEHMPFLIYKLLLFLHAFGDNAQGFANFIIFCLFTERIRAKVVQVFQKCQNVGRPGAGGTVQGQSPLRNQETDLLHEGTTAQNQHSEKTPLLHGAISNC